jgi:hypothetical protein
MGLPDTFIGLDELAAALMIAAKRDVPELFRNWTLRDSAFREEGPPRFMQHTTRSKP